MGDCVIPLKPVYEPSQRAMVELARTVNGVKKKYCVPKAATTDAESVIRTLREFFDVVQDDRLHLNTASLKHEHLRMCFDSPLKEEWDVACVGQPITDDGFATCVRQFLLQIIDEDDIEMLKTMMQEEEWRKPFDMTVGDYVCRLKFVNTMMQFVLKHLRGVAGMPDAPFSPGELKSLFFKGMPKQWKQKFLDSGLSLSDMNLMKLSRYFMRQQNKRTANDHLDRDHKKKVKFDDKNDNNNSNANADAMKHNKKDCPFHPNRHSWYYCYGNPMGPNFKTDFKLKETNLEALKANDTKPTAKKRNNYNQNNSSIEEQHHQEDEQFHSESITTFDDTIAKAMEQNFGYRG